MYVISGQADESEKNKLPILGQSHWKRQKKNKSKKEPNFIRYQLFCCHWHTNILHHPPFVSPHFLGSAPKSTSTQNLANTTYEMTCIIFNRNWCKAEESLGGKTTFAQMVVCTELECVEARPWIVAVCGCCVYFYRNHANKHGRERTTSAVPFLEAKEEGREIHVGRRRWRQRGGEYKLYSTWLYISST
jgi:hypothetical protein